MWTATKFFPIVLGSVWFALVIGAGYAYSHNSVFVRRSRSWRFVRESALVGIVLLVPFSFSIGLEKPSVILNLIGWLSLVSFCLGLPIVAALRFGPGPVAPRRFSVSAYLAGTCVFGVVALVVLGLMMIALPEIILLGEVHVHRHPSHPEGYAFFVLSLAATVTIHFGFARALFETINFALSREYASTKPLPGQQGPTMKWGYRVLCVLALFALIGWASSLLVAFNSQRAYPPPPYSKPILPVISKYFPQMSPFLPSRQAEYFPSAKSGVLLPVLSIIPPLFLIFVGKLVAERSARGPDSFLFCALCFTHAVWDLNVVPNGAIGVVLWQAHVFAGVLVPPLTLDFAVVVSTISSELSNWNRLRTIVYSMFLLISPPTLYLWNKPVADILTEIGNESRMFEVPILSLSGFAGLISYSLFALIGGFVLISAFSSLRRLPTANVLESGNRCRWIRLTEQLGTIDLRQLQRQVHLVLIGILFTFGFLAIYLFVLFTSTNPALAEYDVVPRLLTFLLYLSVTIALFREGLWDTPRKLVFVFLFAIAYVVSLAAWEDVKDRLIERLTGFLAPEPTAGQIPDIVASLVASLIFVWLFSRIRITVLEERIYGWNWPEKRKWQGTLRELPFEAEGRTAEILLCAAPPRSGGSRQDDQVETWLIGPSLRGSNEICIDTLGHLPCCFNQCIPKIREFTKNGDGGARNQVNLTELIKISRETETDRVCYIPGAMVRSQSFRADLARVIRRLRRQISPVTDSESRELAWRLNRARIALVVRLGLEKDAGPIWLIGTNEEGDYYDQRDLNALQRFAEVMAGRINLREHEQKSTAAPEEVHLDRPQANERVGNSRTALVVPPSPRAGADAGILVPHSEDGGWKREGSDAVLDRLAQKLDRIAEAQVAMGLQLLENKDEINAVLSAICSVPAKLEEQIQIGLAASKSANRESRKLLDDQLQDLSKNGAKSEDIIHYLRR